MSIIKYINKIARFRTKLQKITTNSGDFLRARAKYIIEKVFY